MPLIAESTLPEETRLASPLASAGKVGIAFSQPAGSLAARRSSSSAALSGEAFVAAAWTAFHDSLAFAPRRPSVAVKCSLTPSGTRKLASTGQP